MRTCNSCRKRSKPSFSRASYRSRMPIKREVISGIVVFECSHPETESTRKVSSSSCKTESGITATPLPSVWIQCIREMQGLHCSNSAPFYTKSISSFPLGSNMNLQSMTVSSYANSYQHFVPSIYKQKPYLQQTSNPLYRTVPNQMTSVSVKSEVPYSMPSLLSSRMTQPLVYQPVPSGVCGIPSSYVSSFSSQSYPLISEVQAIPVVTMKPIQAHSYTSEPHIEAGDVHNYSTDDNQSNRMNRRMFSYVVSSLTSSPQSYSNLDILAALSLKELSSIKRVGKRTNPPSSTPYTILQSKESKASLQESASVVMLNS